MTKFARLLCAILLIVSAFLMFVPIATFEDNSAAALQEEIDKQVGRLESEQAKLQRYVDQGKKQADLDKQQTKIDKQQAKVDELLAEQAALASQAGQSGLKYALMPSKLPAEIQVNMQVVNENNAIYPTEFDDMYLLAKMAFVLLLAAAAFVLIPNGAPASKFYTWSSFFNLVGTLMAAYAILRLRAIPVKLPYGNPIMNWTIAGMIMGLPCIALYVNCASVVGSKRSMIYVLCTVLCVLSLLPFWIMMVNATRNSQQIQSGATLIPSTFIGHNWEVLSLKNFSISTGFKNSAIIAFGSTILSVYFSALTAYGLTVYRFKGAKFLYSVILGIIMIPGQVTATGFYMFMYKLGWTNSYLPLIIPSIAAASTVFFFKQYLEANFQISLVEAARIDGAGRLRTMMEIMVPLTKPGLVAVCIYTFLNAWDDYLMSMTIMQKVEMKTLTVGLAQSFMGEYAYDYGALMAFSMAGSLPIIIVFIFLQKYMISGLTAGAVKG